VRLREEYQGLRTVPGIGEILALTIALETGDIGRFAHVGNFASYARMVDSRRESNGKKKGEGNTKSGNRYLAWAFIEAANFAVRYDATVKRWYQRKRSRAPLPIVALKAVGHKLARACFYMMRDHKEFDASMSFE
jgi:transposase